MNCLNCDKTLTNPKAKFCSDKCRMAFKRLKPEQKPEQDLISDLEKKSVAELEKEGYWIPNWKKSGYKSRKEVEKAFLDIIDQHPTCKWMFKGYLIEK